VGGSDGQGFKENLCRERIFLAPRIPGMHSERKKGSVAAENSCNFISYSGISTQMTDSRKVISWWN